MIVLYLNYLNHQIVDSNDLSIGFDRHRGRRQRGLTNNKNIKVKYHVITYLKDVFGFAEQQKWPLGLVTNYR